MRFHHGHQADFEEAGMMLARYALQAMCSCACILVT